MARSPGLAVLMGCVCLLVFGIAVGAPFCISACRRRCRSQSRQDEESATTAENIPPLAVTSPSQIEAAVQAEMPVQPASVPSISDQPVPDLDQVVLERKGRRGAKKKIVEVMDTVPEADEWSPNQDPSGVAEQRMQETWRTSKDVASLTTVQEADELREQDEEATTQQLPLSGTCKSQDIADSAVIARLEGWVLFG